MNARGTGHLARSFQLLRGGSAGGCEAMNARGAIPATRQNKSEFVAAWILTYGGDVRNAVRVWQVEVAKLE